MPDSSPDTAVGVRLSDFVPSPSWPNSLLPQHKTAPLEVIAQECLVPTEIATIPSDSTVTGVVAVSSGDGPPSPKVLLYPQHFTSPLEVRAHVRYSLADIDRTPESSPDGTIGEFAQFMSLFFVLGSH